MARLKQSEMMPQYQQQYQQQYQPQYQQPQGDQTAVLAQYQAYLQAQGMDVDEDMMPAMQQPAQAAPAPAPVHVPAPAPVAVQAPAPVPTPKAPVSVPGGAPPVAAPGTTTAGWDNAPMAVVKEEPVVIEEPAPAEDVLDDPWAQAIPDTEAQAVIDDPWAVIPPATTTAPAVQPVVQAPVQAPAQDMMHDMGMGGAPPQQQQGWSQDPWQQQAPVQTQPQVQSQWDQSGMWQGPQDTRGPAPMAISTAPRYRPQAQVNHMGSALKAGLLAGSMQEGESDQDRLLRERASLEDYKMRFLKRVTKQKEKEKAMKEAQAAQMAMAQGQPEQPKKESKKEPDDAAKYTEDRMHQQVQKMVVYGLRHLMRDGRVSDDLIDQSYLQTKLGKHIFKVLYTYVYY
ncbi:hypothetical protein KIPB_004241 [Kipferlia bialata]|nr:hypothetical protein KIPB_004241 [Kipferlia bialata]|eukprot:g4241.t1